MSTTFDLNKLSLSAKTGRFLFRRQSGENCRILNMSKLILVHITFRMLLIAADSKQTKKVSQFIKRSLQSIQKSQWENGE